jgi:hypothetical protein
MSENFTTYDDFAGLLAALALVVLAALAVMRVAYRPLGRFLGFSDPRNFHHWLLIPWRPIYRRVCMPARDWWNELTGYGRGGAAGWTSIAEAASLVYREDRALPGRIRFLGVTFNQYLGAPCQRHSVIVAGARSGKTVFLATLTALRNGPALILDP